MKRLRLIAALGLVGLAGCDSVTEPNPALQEEANTTSQQAPEQASVVNTVELVADTSQDPAVLIASAIELGNFKTLTITPEGDILGKPINPALDKGWKRIDVSGVRVIDGDTVEVLVDGQQSERVRLIGIDAPEYSKNNPGKTQEYGLESKDSLDECVAGAKASIVYKETDRYGRLLGKVFAGNTDCNYRQVVAGSAWHYKQYASSQPNDDSDIYADAEKVAQLQNQGLWSNLNAQEPWSFRKES